ncbi:MAG: hypothetical protein JXR94_23635 [Candidatus Hydrogenedentes bacterium]|nr:hypothetical protein [Candidatus Hydrogenedentota bacterium]
MKAPQPLRIGWASCDVTPDRPANLRGQFHARVSESVNDPLTATALALESADGEQAVMVSLDAVGINDPVRDGCRARIAERIPDLAPEKLFISATHTHTAPDQAPTQYPRQREGVMTDEEYSALLVERISEAIVAAWNAREPGAVAWGLGWAAVGFNRRMSYLDGHATMYGAADDEQFSHVEGADDHSVAVLATYDEAGGLTGVVVNLACPSQCVESCRFVSADFWHDARQELRKRNGEHLHVLAQCSAAGDQSPHLQLHRPAQVRMLELRGLTAPDDGVAVETWMRGEIARRIADAVDDVLECAPSDIRREVVFAHETATLDLPMRRVTESDAAYCREQAKLHAKALEAYADPDPADAAYSRDFRRARYFQKVLDRFESQGGNPTLPMETHIIRLGDIAFATNRFELFLDFGHRIKARSKAVQTFVVQLTGEGTYLPTERAVQAKSYGAGIESNLVGPTGGQVLVEETLKIINGLFSDSAGEDA